MTRLRNKIKEMVSSILPTTCIVFLLSITVTPIPVGTMLLFACGAVMLVIDMGPFSLGTDMSMMLMGEGIGTMLSTSEKRYLMVRITFVIDFIITTAEPDLIVLAHQAPGTPGNTLIWTVTTGAGFSLVMALLRIPSHWSLEYLLMLFYTLVFMLAYSPIGIFMAVAFDSGGVTTGPTTVLFLVTLGIDMANVTQKHAEEEGFGIIALCSIGPILAVLLLGILYELQDAAYTPFEMIYIETSKDIIRISLIELPHYMQEVNKALLPILCFFPLFQLISSCFNKHAIIKILVGAPYTFLGLILFLCGVNVGFTPTGYFVGTQIAALSYNRTLVPTGVLIGFFTVKTESAVHMLTRQVEDISSGTISTKVMLYSLSVDVGISLGIAILHILSCINIMVFLIPGYLIAIVLGSSIPNVFTGITFDSGGVTSGLMTATFLLSSTMGVCERLGGNVSPDAFGIVAIVAVTPLLAIQVPGLVVTKYKETAVGEPQEGGIVEFEEVINERTGNQVSGDYCKPG